MKHYKGYIHKGNLHFYGCHEDRNPDTDLKIPLDIRDYWIKECDGDDCIFKLDKQKAVIVFNFFNIR